MSGAGGGLQRVVVSGETKVSTGLRSSRITVGPLRFRKELKIDPITATTFQSATGTRGVASPTRYILQIYIYIYIYTNIYLSHMYIYSMGMPGVETVRDEKGDESVCGVRNTQDASYQEAFDPSERGERE